MHELRDCRDLRPYPANSCLFRVRRPGSTIRLPHPLRRIENYVQRAAALARAAAVDPSMPASCRPPPRSWCSCTGNLGRHNYQLAHERAGSRVAALHDLGQRVRTRSVLGGTKSTREDAPITALQMLGAGQAAPPLASIRLSPPNKSLPQWDLKAPVLLLNHGH